MQKTRAAKPFAAKKREFLQADTRAELFYPQIALMTQIFWGHVVQRETDRTAVETLKARKLWKPKGSTNVRHPPSTVSTMSTSPCAVGA